MLLNSLHGAAVETNPLNQSSILVVEDDPDTRELIRYNLQNEGYRILEAASGEEGLEAFEKEHPDLVLLDLMLPGVQGLEVCRILRSNKDMQNTPVIVVTAKGEEADVAELNAWVASRTTRPDC